MPGDANKRKVISRQKNKLKIISVRLNRELEGSESNCSVDILTSNGAEDKGILSLNN